MPAPTAGTAPANAAGWSDRATALHLEDGDQIAGIEGRSGIDAGFRGLDQALQAQTSFEFLSSVVVR